MAVVYKELLSRFAEGGFERRLPVFDAAARERNIAGLVAEGERAALKEDEELPVFLNQGEKDSGLSLFFCGAGALCSARRISFGRKCMAILSGVLDKVGTAA